NSALRPKNAPARQQRSRVPLRPFRAANRASLCPASPIADLPAGVANTAASKLALAPTPATVLMRDALSPQLRHGDTPHNSVQKSATRRDPLRRASIPANRRIPDGPSAAPTRKRLPATKDNKSRSL